MIAWRSLARHWLAPLCCTALTVAVGCSEPLLPRSPAVRVLEHSPLEPPPPGVIPDGGDGWQALAVGRDHVCALDAAGAAYCWGNDTHSQLGADRGELLCGPPATFCTTVPSRVRTNLRFASVTAGGMHSCGVATDGRGYCWGANTRGQLGTPSPQLAAEPVAINGDRHWRTLAAGVDHTCGVTVDGALYCWGGNARGQLGNQSFLGSATPLPIRPQAAFTEVAAGQERTCAVATDADVLCWGLVWQYTLGDIDWSTAFSVPIRVRTESPPHSISVGVFHACGIAAAGEGVCWGSGQFGQRGDGGVSGSTFPRKVVGTMTFLNVSAGSIHSCGVSADRRAYCWGNNSFGQLGATVDDECMGASCTTVPVPVDTPLRWIDVRTGPGSHACGISTLTNIYCWGLNSAGQLGIGINAVGYRPHPTRVGPPA